MEQSRQYNPNILYLALYDAEEIILEPSANVKLLIEGETELSFKLYKLNSIFNKPSDSRVYI